ncbi:hypothetical protein TCAL_08660 [Tigriopus californicus]|uniref:glycogenin glucosyltransferase n=2 Tax=Tigriopus californicus TaxID=6832 RepID=A0A553PB95_TIGCA|nr:hypothetical protein TCAL_08660 [Tigriopus californicus]
MVSLIIYCNDWTKYHALPSSKNFFFWGKVQRLSELKFISNDCPYLRSSETRRVASPSREINCLQTPLTLDDRVQYLPDQLVLGQKFAYVWYAASTPYLCSALTALKWLQNHRLKNPWPIKFHVDYILMFVNKNLPGGVNNDLLGQWKLAGGLLKNMSSVVAAGPHPYYKATYQKFQAFKLIEYARAIFLDADGIPLKTLDHLFQIRLPSNITIAAPQAYWFKNNGILPGSPQLCPGVRHVTVTSALMLFKPSLELFERVSQHFGTKKIASKKTNYDMDIVNKEFSCRDNIFILPKHYGTLDSEFCKDAQLFKRTGNCRYFPDTQYMHFSALGKPWTRGDAEARYYISTFSYQVAVQLIEWQQAAQEMCPKVINALKL